VPVVKDKSRFVKKHLLIDREKYKQLALIAAEKYGTPVRTIYLVLDEAISEYIERRRKR